MDCAFRWPQIDSQGFDAAMHLPHKSSIQGSGTFASDILPNGRPLIFPEISVNSAASHPALLGAAVPLSPGSSVTPSTVTSSPSNYMSESTYGALSPFVSGDLGGGGNGKGAQFTIITNVPYDTVRQDLVMEFRKYGRVELAMVVCDEASRHPHKEWTSTLGYAFVRFSKRSEAAAAIQAAALGLISIRGTRVRADWAKKDSYAKRSRAAAGNMGPQQTDAVYVDANLGAKCSTAAAGSSRQNSPLACVPQQLLEPISLVVDEKKPASVTEKEGGLDLVRKVSLDLALGLSPISRSVLTGALSDLGARELLTDISPPGPQGRKLRTPAELLHLAVCAAPLQWDAELDTAASTGAKRLAVRVTDSDFSTVSDEAQ